MLQEHYFVCKETESEGVAANGDEDAIPAQKDGLVRYGGLGFQQNMSSLGGSCKNMRFFCTYCETNGGNYCLLGYVSGVNVCSMCICNGPENCDHKYVNDVPVPELESKGFRLVDLLDDFRRRTLNENTKLIDMLPSKSVDCFSGYDENLKKIIKQMCLRNRVADNCMQMDTPSPVFITEVYKLI